MTEQVFNEGMNYYKPEDNENALKIRLETDDTLEKIEMYLKGESYMVDKDGNLIGKVQDTPPKANAEGCRAIMSAITSYINKSSVQGNLTPEQVGLIMNDFHRGMANLFAFHCDEWGIERNERKAIINFVEPFVFMFVTRTKDNKERESYGMTIKQSGQQILDHTKRASLFSRA